MAHRDYIAYSIHRLKKVKNHNSWIFDNISSYLGQDILEVNCGIGNITNLLIGGGRKVAAIDIDADFARYAGEKYRRKKGVCVSNCDILGYEPGKKINTVIMLNVLEHIREDRKVIKESHSLLKRGGLVIILVPAMQSIYGSLDEQLGHVKRYSKGDLQEALGCYGFETVSSFYMNSIGTFGWYLNAKILKRKHFPEKQARIFGTAIVPWMKRLESHVSLFSGSQSSQ